jgi:DNA-binding XRE family transcriptional regulator
MTETPTFGPLLRSKRERLGILERQMAEHIGVSRRTIIAWETSAKLPSLTRIGNGDGGPGPLALAYQLPVKLLTKHWQHDRDLRRLNRLLGLTITALAVLAEACDI